MQHIKGCHPVQPQVVVRRLQSFAATGDQHVPAGVPTGQTSSYAIEGEGQTDALTDGMLILRAMFGLTGSAVTTGVVGGSATRGTWDLIQPFLNAHCGTNFAP